MEVKQIIEFIKQTRWNSSIFTLLLSFLTIFPVESKNPSFSKPMEFIGLNNSLMYVDSTYHWKEGIKDVHSFYKYVRKYARRGFPSDINTLGYLYFYGKGVQKDTKRALKCFKRAAQLGDPTAMINAGNCYLYGWGSDSVSYTLAYKYYKQAADKDYFAGKILLGIYLSLYDDSEQRKAFADSLLKSSLQELEQNFSGNDHATYYIGECYRWGIGVEKNDKKAFEYISKASQTYFPALYELATFYSLGIGVPANRDLEFKCIEAAAEKNVTDAQVDLGFCYVYGRRIEKDYDKAYYLFLSASINGNCKGTTALAKCYKYGWGVKKDEREYEKLMKYNY